MHHVGLKDEMRLVLPDGEEASRAKCIWRPRSLFIMARNELVMVQILGGMRTHTDQIDQHGAYSLSSNEGFCAGGKKSNEIAGVKR